MARIRQMSPRRGYLRLSLGRTMMQVKNALPEF
jgi:hypothetical protein